MWQVEPHVPKQNTSAILWPWAELFLLSLQPVARVESERSQAAVPYLNWKSSRVSQQPRSIESTSGKEWGFSPALLCSVTLEVIRSTVTSMSVWGQGTVMLTSVWSQSLTGLILFLCPKVSPPVGGLQSRSLSHVLGLYHYSLGEEDRLSSGSRNGVWG